MARKKRSSKKGMKTAGKPAILSIARPPKTRAPKSKIGGATVSFRGKTSRVARRTSISGKRRSARYK